MPKRPESEILAKFFADMGEKCGENLAKTFADFCPSISRKIGRIKFHEKSAATFTSHEIEFFHCETLGAWGHKLLDEATAKKTLAMQAFSFQLSTRTKNNFGNERKHTSTQQSTIKPLNSIQQSGNSYIHFLAGICFLLCLGGCSLGIWGVGGGAKNLFGPKFPPRY